MASNSLQNKPKNTVRLVSGIAAGLWAVLIFAISSIPGSSLPDQPELIYKVAHFIEYAILAALLTLAINGPKRALWVAALIALLVASAYGASDEFHQSFTGRSPDVWDWVADTLGAIIGAIATIWFLSARKVKRSRSRDSKLGL